MSTPLRWREADRDDREALKQFTCTVAVDKSAPDWTYRTKHPRPWELAVQSYIRDKLRPPVQGGRVLMLGEDEEGLAAVILGEDRGVNDLFVNLIAVSTRLRGGDGSAAIEMLEVLVDFLVERAAAGGHTVISLQGKVHDQNVPCKRLLERLGATPTDVVEPGIPELRIWEYTATISEDDQPESVRDGRG